MVPCPHCGDVHDPGMHFCARTGEPIDLGTRLIGQTILGHYRVISLLGQGPLGVVVEVEDEESGIRMAAKILHPSIAREDSEVNRFLDEARKAGTLGHPNLATVYEAALDAGRAPTVVRELLVGECLADLIKRLDPMPIDLAVHYTRQILSGLGAAHKAGIVNLDLTPADIFISMGHSGSQIVKLVDFGEAHLKHENLSNDKGEPLSSDYFAPEQRKSGWECDHRADIYAAGVILYEMLTGKPPAKLPRPVSQLRKEVNKLLGLIVSKSIEMNLDRRYQKAEEFERAIKGLGIARPQPVELNISQGVTEPAAAPAPLGSTTPYASPAQSFEKPEQTEDSWSGMEERQESQETAPQAAFGEITGTEDTQEQLEQHDTEEAPAESSTAPQSWDVSPPPSYMETGEQTPEEFDQQETEQEEPGPSVIVDMPEAEDYASMIPKRPVWHYAVVGAVIVLIIGLIIIGLSGGDDEIAAPADEKPAPAAEELVKIEINISPENAKVWLDGDLITKRPLVLDLPKSKKTRTLKASAENFENLEKIVVFDKSQLVKMSLSEIVKPAEEDIEEVVPDSEQPAVEEIASTKEPPKTPEVKKTSTVPKSAPAKASRKKPAARKTTRTDSTSKRKPARKKSRKSAKKAEEEKKAKRGGFTSESPY